MVLKNKKKKILVTGGAGYIGSCLVNRLIKKGYHVKVLDRLFFSEKPVEKLLGHDKFELMKNDIRHVSKSYFSDVDTVIHLAAISNDPACDLDERVTREVNYEGTVRIAKFAKEAGVKKFIFSSSCSVYGHSDKLMLTESSPLNPVSLYAKAKVAAEKDLLKLNDGKFSVCILRNGTVFGISPRMRFDLVVNIMTLNAYKNKKIFVMGGGRQWRPNVHVQDVCSAFIKAAEAPASKISGKIFNVGENAQNLRVLQVANIVKSQVPGTSIEDVPSDPDQRDYNVEFALIHRVLNYKAEKSVVEGVKEIVGGLSEGVLTDEIMTRTLDYYKYLINAHKVLKDVLLDSVLL